MEIRPDLRRVFFSSVTLVCAAAGLCAQNFVSLPATRDAAPLLISHRQLAALTIVRIPPEYPPVARVNYIEGLVAIRINVSDQGRVASAHILSGNPMLASAALKAVAHWTYRPLATAAGPSGFCAIVKVRFTSRHPTVPLSPKEAERDFLKQVKPPRVVSPESPPPGEMLVHLRLLVNDEGQVVDRDSPTVDQARVDAAAESLRAWRFEPARWGTMPIASYLTVDVPVGAAPVTRVAAIPGLH